MACNWNICSLQKGREKACTSESLKGDKVLEKAGLKVNQVLSFPPKKKKIIKQHKNQGPVRARKNWKDIQKF